MEIDFDFAFPDALGRSARELFNELDKPWHLVVGKARTAELGDFERVRF
jgi:hypothetical protein